MRIHNRNNMIHKGNTFYQDCKCFYYKNPVGVTEKPRWNSNGAFCMHIRIIDYLCIDHSIDNHEQTDHLGSRRAVFRRTAAGPDAGPGCTLLQPASDGDRPGKRLGRRQCLPMGGQVLHVLHRRRRLGVFRHAQLGLPLCGRGAGRAGRVSLQRQVLHDRQQFQRVGGRQPARTV